MQDLILIISRCLSLRSSPKTHKSFYCFHFKGFYAGEKIKIIHLFPPVYGPIQEQLIKGEDYLLWVKRKNVKAGVLEVELISCKKII